MNSEDKLNVLAKAKKKSKRGNALKLLKRNAVPKNKGGRKNAPAKGGGARAALMRKIHKDPDIQRLLEKNPKYDIIVVKKVTASVFARAMVKASDNGTQLDKEAWWNVAQKVNKDYSRETFDRDWNEFQAIKEGNSVTANRGREKINKYDQDIKKFRTLYKSKYPVNKDYIQDVLEDSYSVARTGGASHSDSIKHAMKTAHEHLRDKSLLKNKTSKRFDLATDKYLKKEDRTLRRRNRTFYPEY